MSDNTTILFSNSFPFSLIRRSVRVEPRSLDELRAVLSKRPFISCWGHANTARQASIILQQDISPVNGRLAIQLGKNNFPLIANRQCTECWLLSPQYRLGFRPAPGIEVEEQHITGWQVLRLQWN